MRRWLPALILLLPLAALLPIHLAEIGWRGPPPYAPGDPVSDPADWPALYAEGRAAYEAQDYETAVARFLPIAMDGYTPAQVMMGRMFARGEGLPEDNCLAVLWYDRAARAGNAEAQYRLGANYMTYYGNRRDRGLAYYWIMTAMNNGYDGPAFQVDRLNRMRERDPHGPVARLFDDAMVENTDPEDMPPTQVYPFFILGEVRFGHYIGKMLDEYGYGGC